MSRIKKITTWIAAFGIAGVVIAVFALRSSDDLNLKTKATRVLDTKSRKYSGDPSYDWLSDHELLLFRQEWRKSTWFFVPVRYDLETGAESRLGVSRIFSTYRGYGIPFRTELSPDRKSLLWWGNYGHTYLGTLDGSRFRSWKGWEEETHWLGNDRVVAFDFKRTGVAMARIQNVNARVSVLERSVNAIQMRDHFVTVDGRLISLDRGAGRPSSRLDELRILEIGSPTKSFKINTLGVRGILDTALSPGAERLAMVVRAVSLSPIQRLLGRIVPIQPEYTVEIRTCKTDGSDMRTIASLPESQATATAHNVTFTADHFPLALRWLPNGNRLSFVYRDALLTIPVD